MADSSGESLLLRLGLDASGFTAGARNARKEMGALEKGVGSLKGELASLASGVAAGVGFAVLTHEALEFAEAVTKVAAQTGLSVESVQYLRFAADQTGTSVDSLAGMVNKLQRQMVEAGSNDKLRAKMEEIVGPIEELRALRPEDQLQKVSQAIANIHDPAERTAASVTLLGKSGAEAIPEMVELAEKGDQMAAAFERTGGAVSGDTIAAVEGLGDALSGTKTALIAMATELLGTAAPALTSFLETVTEVIGGLRLLDGQGADASVNLSNRIDQEEAKLKQLKNTGIMSRGGIKAASEEQIAVQEKLVKSLRDEYDTMHGLGEAGAARIKADKAVSDSIKANAADLLDATIKNLTDEEAQRALFREIRYEGDTALEDRLFAMRAEAAARYAKAQITAAEVQSDGIRNQQFSLDQDIATATENAGALKIHMWEQETQGIAQLLQQQTEGVARHSKAVFEINKAAGIVNTTISTIQAVVKAWSDYGWPVGAIIGAAVAVAGAAQVQAIASAKFGQKTAPSQASTPATPVAQAQGGGGGGGSGKVMEVRGVSANSLLTGSMVRELTAAISDHVKDGGRVEWANS